MPEFHLEQLRPSAAEKIRPFLEEVMSRFAQDIDSIQVTGTALTDDYHEQRSDVNSILILKEMDLKILELLAPFGKKHGKQRVAAPLMMTPVYIRESLDVFPLEFLNFKLIHAAVYGEDLFKDITIDMKDLRNQCEREIKTRLIGLRQGYISSQGDRKLLGEGMIKSIKAAIPLFRGIITLLGKTPPVLQRETIAALSEAAGIDTAAFSRALDVKHAGGKTPLEDLNVLFKEYYEATEQVRKIVDEM